MRSSRLQFLAPLVVMLACAAPSCFADNQIVDQKDKAFSKAVVKIKVGDSVEFRNSDPLFHNVFSLSDTKSFDLGSYPAGESKKVVFDKPGVVEVECSIHPNMTMRVEVAK